MRLKINIKNQKVEEIYDEEVPEDMDNIDPFDNYDDYKERGNE